MRKIGPRLNLPMRWTSRTSASGERNVGPGRLQIIRYAGRDPPQTAHAIEHPRETRRPVIGYSSQPVKGTTSARLRYLKTEQPGDCLPADSIASAAEAGPILR
jgi:hypothetical protein